MNHTREEKSSIMFIEYKRPDREGMDMGPQRSTFRTGVRVCLPSMQCSHFEGGWDEVRCIPSMMWERAMSRTVREPQWPRHWCHVSMFGECEV